MGTAARVQQEKNAKPNYEAALVAAFEASERDRGAKSKGSADAQDADDDRGDDDGVATDDDDDDLGPEAKEAREALRASEDPVLEEFNRNGHKVHSNSAAYGRFKRYRDACADEAAKWEKMSAPMRKRRVVEWMKDQWEPYQDRRLVGHGIGKASRLSCFSQQPKLFPKYAGGV